MGARGAFSLRTHLIAFGIAILLPVTVLAGGLLIRSAMIERAEIEARLVQIADDLAFDIDREMDRQITVLQTLATLPSLQAEDWPAFYEQAKAAVGEQGYVILIDSNFRQLVNTFVPYGEQPAVTGDPETARRMIATKKPDVSDLFVSLVTKMPVYNVNIPILRDGDVRYILHLGQLPDRIQAILRNQRIAPEWNLAVLDRKGVVLARSRDPARYVGQAPARYAADAQIELRGIRTTKSLEDVDVLRAGSRSRISGWLATASVPVALAEEPLRRSLWQWSATAIFALTGTIILGILFGRTLERPMMAAADAAAALGRNAPVPHLQSRLNEANTIVEALAQAREELTQREKAQQVLADELSHRVKNVLSVVQTLVNQTLSSERSIPEARRALSERIYALARSHNQLFHTDWKGVSIKEIIDAELAPFPDRVTADGPAVIVDARRVQTFHLVLHELATNAVKYGSLSNQYGAIHITWSVSNTPNEHFKFRWEERGGPLVNTPIRKGFGRTLLASAFSGMDAEPRIEFGSAGLVYEFEAPLEAIGRKPDGQMGP